MRQPITISFMSACFIGSNHITYTEKGVWNLIFNMFTFCFIPSKSSKSSNISGSVLCLSHLSLCLCSCFQLHIPVANSPPCKLTVGCGGGPHPTVSLQAVSAVMYILFNILSYYYDVGFETVVVNECSKVFLANQPWKAGVCKQHFGDCLCCYHEELM